MTILEQNKLKLGNDNKPHLISFLEDRSITVAFLKDRDFAADVLLPTSDKHTFYWDLPCIESYLILDYLLKMCAADQATKVDVIEKNQKLFRGGGAVFLFRRVDDGCRCLQ